MALYVYRHKRPRSPFRGEDTKTQGPTHPTKGKVDGLANLGLKDLVTSFKLNGVALLLAKAFFLLQKRFKTLIGVVCSIL
jgi:hypothetical protein